MNKISIIFGFLLFLLVFSVSAINIHSPQEQTYTSTNVKLNASHNETLDMLWFSIDQSTPLLACENCNNFVAELNLLEGNHSLFVKGILGNKTINTSVSFSIMLPVPAPVEHPFSVQVHSPEASIYTEGTIDVDISSNMTLDTLSYTINGFEESCENCSELIDTLNLDEGEYELLVLGKLGSVSKITSVNFSVVEPDENNEFAFTIISPQSKTYKTGIVDVKIRANRTLDKLSYEIDGEVTFCENCSLLIDKLNLSEGIYVLSVTGLLEGLSIEKSVQFKVDKEYVCQDNCTPNEWNWSEARFDRGWNKLPQLIENGDISEEELVALLQENKLNPGILNRLIKTGLLGEDSLNAILETQYQPEGIFRKLMNFFGWQQETVAENIYTHYSLNERLEQRIVQREDLPSVYKTQVKEKLQERLAERTRVETKNLEDSGKEEREKKEKRERQSYSLGSQGTPQNIPPGQAKKFQNVNSKQHENGYLDEESSDSEDSGRNNKVSENIVKKSNSKNSGSKR